MKLLSIDLSLCLILLYLNPGSKKITTNNISKIIETISAIKTHQSNWLNKAATNVSVKDKIPPEIFNLSSARDLSFLNIESKLKWRIWINITNKCDSISNIRKNNNKKYIYPHNYPNGWVKQNYLPKEIDNKKYYNRCLKKKDRMLKIN